MNPLLLLCYFPIVVLSSEVFAPGSHFWTQIHSDRGVTLKTAFFAPDTVAKIAVVLLEGGNGTVTIDGPASNPIINDRGFLARNAKNFAKHGVLVAISEPPSDHPEGIDPLTYRTTKQQSTDTKAIIEYMKQSHQKIGNLSVWVQGMSLGCFSATQVALDLKDLLSGFGVVSVPTQPPGGGLAARFPEGIISMGLGSIAMPAVICGDKQVSRTTRSQFSCR